MLEFGVYTAESISTIASALPQRKIIGFDHFQGLEQTEHFHPLEWCEGAFKLDAFSVPFWLPRTIEEVFQKTECYRNIRLIVEDIHQLKEPNFYGISKIAGVHIDVKIYEPTVSALNFIERCEWSLIFIRFSDWHSCEEIYDSHGRLALKEWVERNGFSVSIPINGLSSGVFVFRNSHSE
ncbi:MAG: hypothetical protein JSS32_08660 [Verrucomicrobia bacterium]|nr:hypothetical protein [Verrucomicrobiota bacterium]